MLLVGFPGLDGDRARAKGSDKLPGCKSLGFLVPLVLRPQSSPVQDADTHTDERIGNKTLFDKLDRGSQCFPFAGNQGMNALVVSWYRR
jgi:hypothetical protein